MQSCVLKPLMDADLPREIGKAVISQGKFVVMGIKNPACDCGVHCGSVPLFGHG